MGETRQPARFLFLHSQTGGGHQRVALAVTEALKERYGDRAQIELVDALAAYAPWPFCRLPDWYGGMLWGGGLAYGLGFRLLDRQRLARTLSRICWPWVAPAARRLLALHPADVVVAFHPVLIQTVARALAEAGASAPLVAVGTDLVVMHALWADSHVRRYLVATEAARARLARHGVDPARVEVVGLPVGRCFREVVQEDPYALRSRLGLDSARPLVLVMGGGEGFGPLERLAQTLARLPTQVVVLTGRNERLCARLTRSLPPGSARVERFTPEVQRWMRAADLLVTKAGPNTIAEALVVGTPLVLWGAIPAQETPNVRLVVEAGAGVWAPGSRWTAAAVARLLGDGGRRAQMRERGRWLACPQAAERAAGVLWEIAQSHR